jgi:hypothetical protein
MSQVRWIVFVPVCPVVTPPPVKSPTLVPATTEPPLKIATVSFAELEEPAAPPWSALY